MHLCNIEIAVKLLNVLHTKTAKKRLLWLLSMSINRGGHSKTSVKDKTYMPEMNPDYDEKSERPKQKQLKDSRNRSQTLYAVLCAML